MTRQDSGGLSNRDRNIGRLSHRLCIVARNHPLLFGYLSTLFRDRPIGSEQIELVIDRRHPESPRPPDVERRRPSEIDEELRRRGFAFVVEPGETFRPRDAARIEHTVELLAGMEERSWPFRRRRRRPVLERVWGQRAGRTLAILAGVALVVAFASSEFRMNDLRDSDLIGWPFRSLSRVATSSAPRDKPQADAPAPVVASPPAPVPAAPPAPTTTAPSAPAPVAVAPPAPPAPVVAAAPPAPPAPVAAAPPTPAKQAPVAAAPPSAARVVPHGPAPAPAAPTQAVSPAAAPAPPKATAAPKAMAAAEAPAPSSRTAGAAPREAASRAALPDRPRSLASSSSAAPMVRTSAREPAAPGSGREPAGTVATTAPAPVSGDLRIELSRKPTSATGGGVVFLVRVTDLAGQPLSDAEVSMLAGRRPGGALFETRLYPAESPGTFRSGVIHPSTLPPDLTVMAVAGNRHVETLVAR